MSTRRNRLVSVLLVTSLILVIMIVVIQFSRNQSQPLLLLINEEINDESPTGTMLIGSSTADIQAASPHYFLLDIHEENEGQFQQFLKTFEYAKIPYTVISEQELSSLEPSSFHTLITATENLTENHLLHISSFVEQGGNLYVGKRFNKNEYNDMVGINENDGFTKKSIHGLEIVRPWGTIYEKLSHVEDIINNSMLITLAEESQLYIKSGDTPLFWTSQYGQGRIGYFNGTWLSSKSSRGLFLQTLQLVPNRFTSSLTGVEVIFIDDFPAPFPKKWGKDPLGYEKKYSMSPSSFFQEVWWSDMKEIAKENDLLYTAVMIGTYDNTLSSTGKKLSEVNRKELTYYARESYLNGYEIGFHGYNHQPLVLPSEPIDESLGYQPWKDNAALAQGISHMQHLLKSYYPTSEFKTYVPPSNILGKEGLSVLVDELPGLRTISSVYDGHIKGSYVQEIGEDDTYPNVFNLPRFSSGFHVDESNKLGAIDAAGHLGMVSHFVHPDDLISSRANGLTWEQLKMDYKEFIVEFKQAYPVLKAYTANQATIYLQSYLKGNVDIQYTDSAVLVKATDMPAPMRIALRLNGNERLDLSPSNDYTIYPLDSENTSYQIEIRKSSVVLPVLKGADMK